MVMLCSDGHDLLRSLIIMHLLVACVARSMVHECDMAHLIVERDRSNERRRASSVDDLDGGANVGCTQKPFSTISWS